MLKRLLPVSLIAVALSATMGVTGAFAEDAVTVNVSPQSARDGGAAGFNEAGTATLTPMGDKTQVVLNLTGAPAGTAQPAHIHVGQCPGVAAVKWPLTNVMDGKSTTMVDAKLSDITTGGYAINIHKSTAEAGQYVTCGNIAAVAGATTAAPAAASTSSVPVAAPATGMGGGAGQHGSSITLWAAVAAGIAGAGAFVARARRRA